MAPIFVPENWQTELQNGRFKGFAQIDNTKRSDPELSQNISFLKYMFFRFNERQVSIAKQPKHPKRGFMNRAKDSGGEQKCLIILAIIFNCNDLSREFWFLFQSQEEKKFA